MTRKKPTDSELRQASDHIHYEIAMLQQTVSRLREGQDDKVISNALKEAFGIHARILLHVFYPEHPKSDDVLAADFFSEPADWTRHRSALTPNLLDVRRRVGKEIVHLTYTRVPHGRVGQKWPYSKIANDIRDVVKVFCERAPHDNLGDKLKAFFKTPGK